VPTITLKEAGAADEVAKKMDVVPLVADISGVTFRRLSPEEIKGIATPKRKRRGRRRK
jgi:hypothetical protein